MPGGRVRDVSPVHRRGHHPGEPGEAARPTGLNALNRKCQSLAAQGLLFLDAKVIYFELCKISIFLLQDPDIDVRSVLERIPI